MAVLAAYLSAEESEYKIIILLPHLSLKKEKRKKKYFTLLSVFRDILCSLLPNYRTVMSCNSFTYLSLLYVLLGAFRMYSVT